MKGFVYIAGPYSDKLGLCDHEAYEEIDRNISEARTWAVRMATDGIPFFCPHLNTAHFEMIAPLATRDFFLDAGLAVLEKATALFLLPKWGASVGTRKELEFACQRGTPVYNEGTYYLLVQNWKKN